jgi:hypothetical protein
MLCLDESESSPPVTATPGPCEGAPDYSPGDWNDGGDIQCCNNCYNYACDIPTNNFAQPGHASHGGSSLPYGLDCSGVTQAGLDDGLTVCTDSCHPCEHKVALAIWPGRDYHWYRQDAGGMWSHKPGSTAARNVDNSNNLIADPAMADRWPYTNFCGYFCVYKPDVDISGSSCPYYC